MSPSPLERVAAGDATAVQDCLSAYGGLVASIARKLLHSPSDVDDAVQDVFIELWQKAARFDAARGSPEAFVGTIARRRVIDRIRKQARRPESELLTDTFVSDAEEQPDQLHTREVAANAVLVMERLTPVQRQTIQLAVMEGRSHSEVAEKTGLPLGTVKSHVRRGLLRLREMLDVPQDD